MRGKPLFGLIVFGASVVGAKPANATEYTGCLNGAGTLTAVQAGSAPAKACSSEEKVIHLNASVPGSQGPAGPAGPTGPQGPAGPSGSGGRVHITHLPESFFMVESQVIIDYLIANGLVTPEEIADWRVGPTVVSALALPAGSYLVDYSGGVSDAATTPGCWVVMVDGDGVESNLGLGDYYSMGDAYQHPSDGVSFQYGRFSSVGTDITVTSQQPFTLELVCQATAIINRGTLKATAYGELDEQ